MSPVTIARLSSLVGAAVWFLGLPIAVGSGAVFVTDATYFWIGAVVTALGLAMAPIALVYPAGPHMRLARIVRALGVVACLGLVLSGALLIGGSVGLLGDKPPGWITDAPAIPLTGLFVWVVLASYSARQSPAVGRWAFWLGMLAGTSWLLGALDSVLIPVHTNDTIPIDTISALLLWLCLPAWLIALAVRMRREGGVIDLGTNG